MVGTTSVLGPAGFLLQLVNLTKTFPQAGSQFHHLPSEGFDFATFKSTFSCDL